MISKARIKFIHSLSAKKFRKVESMFVAEGHKLVGELLSAGYSPRYLCATAQWQNDNPGVCVNNIVTDEELQQASLLKTPQRVLGLFSMPDWVTPLPSDCGKQLTLALDGVQDPGNLGTICRLADWFGIGHILCSPDTADIFNPKATQATMGAIARIQVHYVDLPHYLNEAARCGIPIYGTFLDGRNIYECELSCNGIIVMGNEGNGISDVIEGLVTDKLYIPNYPAGRETTESLNVAVATAITCAEFRRRG